MSQYTYRCSENATHLLIETYPMGTAPRSVECPTCTVPMNLVIGAGVNIAKSSLEHKGEAVRNQIAMEHGLREDMPAYKRLRDRGLQPNSVQGAAELERHAEDQFDIDYGDIVPCEDKQRIKEGLAEAALINMGVV